MGSCPNAENTADTRRNITLVTPFVLVLLGVADHERAERKRISYRNI